MMTAIYLSLLVGLVVLVMLSLCRMGAKADRDSERERER
jgi:hypothetical protein